MKGREVDIRRKDSLFPIDKKLRKGPYGCFGSDMISLEGVG
jgi:hypothetical protein